MIKLKHVYLMLALVFLASIEASAKARIPMGEREVLTKVVDLPDTDDYKIGEGKSAQYIDLATLHKEYNIAYLLPLYVIDEPKLVGYNAKEDLYYDLTPEQLNTIVTENKIDVNKVNKLGFYTRYGGKLVTALIVALIIYGLIPGKKKKVEPTQV